MHIKVFIAWLTALVSVEMLSWLGFANSSWMPIFFGIVVCITLVATYFNLHWGLQILLAELTIGSFGYVLFLETPMATISIRMAIFGIVMLGWVWHSWREKKVYFFSLSAWPWWVALGTVFVVGIVNGWLHGNMLSNILSDANAYMFYALALPVSQVFGSTKSRDDLVKQACTFVPVILAGVIVLALQTIFIVFTFSHSEVFMHYLPSLYQWIRDLRIGEITAQPNGFYRVFFQSHIYVLVVYGALITAALIRWEYKILPWLILSEGLIFLSYSRSFWLVSILITGVIMLYVLVVRRAKIAELIRVIMAILGSAVIAYALILFIVNVPLPTGSGSGVDAVSLLTDRTEDATSEAAGSSRLALLGPLAKATTEYPLLGQGFGTTVSYASKDPRAMASNPDGIYTTFAFEWGYLDLLLKLGLFGTTLFAIVILLPIWQVLKLERNTTDQLSVDVYIAIVCIGIVLLTHALTPYVNHPLGIGLIVFSVLYLLAWQSRKAV